MRSTRIRTLDRTLEAIPNGKLAEMRTESFSARDRLRLACTVGVLYQTWFTTREWSEFQVFRQELLLGFMEVVKSAGTSFAFPTRTVHVAGERPSPGAAAEQFSEGSAALPVPVGP